MDAVTSVFFKPPQSVLSQRAFETAILEKLNHIARITAIFSQRSEANEIKYLTWVSSHIKFLEAKFHDRLKETFEFLCDVEVSL